MSKKTVTEEAVPVEVAEVTPVVPAEVLPAPAPVGNQKRSIYALLINDEVSSGTNAPVGGWFVQYIDFKSQEVWGPLPLMTPTRRGQAQMSGFVHLDDLRSTAEYVWEHELAHGAVKHPGQSLELVSGSNKMMSCWIAK